MYKDFSDSKDREEHQLGEKSPGTVKVVDLETSLILDLGDQGPVNSSLVDTCKNAAVNNKPSVADFIVVIFTPELNGQQNKFNILAARPKGRHNRDIY